jgi:hypothetical protein
VRTTWGEVGMSERDGPGGPYGPQPGAWGAYGPAAAPPQRMEDMAVWALALAIASFALLPVVPAVIALFLAASADRRIAASRGMLGGHGMVRAARIVAWVNLAVAAAVLVLLLVAVVLIVVATGAAPGHFDRGWSQ